MEYVKIGQIVNTFGIKGEVKVANTSDFVSDRYQTDSLVYIGEHFLALRVKKYRWHKGFLLVQFVDHEDINLVEQYKGLYIYKALEDIKPLNEGEYYFSDIVGLDVFIGEKKVGKVISMEEGFKYNYLRILTDDKQQKMVPFILDTFIKMVDLKQNKLVLVEMEGLL